MSSVPVWVLIVTALGTGAIGSVVTAYAAQTKDRRQARSGAREAIREAEGLVKQRDVTWPQLATAFDRLETSAMVAGLPKGLTDLYRATRPLGRRQFKLASGAVTPTDRQIRIYAHVGYQAAELLVATTWHPCRSLPYRLYRTRHLKRLLAVANIHIGESDKRNYRKIRKWERITIRQKGEAQKSAEQVLDET